MKKLEIQDADRKYKETMANLNENFISSIIAFFKAPIMNWIAYKNGLSDDDDDPDSLEIAFEYNKAMEEQRERLEKYCKDDPSFPPCSDLKLGKFTNKYEDDWTPALRKKMTDYRNAKNAKK